MAKKSIFDVIGAAASKTKKTAPKAVAKKAVSNAAKSTSKAGSTAAARLAAQAAAKAAAQKKAQAAAKAAAQKKAQQEAADRAKRKANAVKAATALKQASSNLTKMRSTERKYKGGLVLATGKTRLPQGATRGNVHLAKSNATSVSKKGYENYKKSNTDALGVKTKEKSYKSATGAIKEIERAGKYSAATADVNKTGASGKAKKKLLEQQTKQIDKELDKKYSSKVKYRNLTMEEHLRMQNAIRTGGGNAKLTGKMLSDDVKKNIANQYSANYKNAKKRTAFLEGASPIDIQNFTRNMTKDDKGNSRLDERTIKQAENSVGYKAANMAGFMAGSLTTGVGGAPEKALGESIAKGLAKVPGKQGVKKFAADRLADVVVSSPYDAVDSLKGAVDENGNVDWKQAAKNMGVNVASNIVLGGALDLGGKGLNKVLSKSDSKKVIKLIAKQKEGVPLTAKETKLVNKVMAKAKQDYVEKAGKQAVEEVRAKNVKKTEPASASRNGLQLPKEKNFAGSSESSIYETSPKSNGSVLKAEQRTSKIAEMNVAPEFKEVFSEYVSGTNVKLVEYADDVIKGKPTAKAVSIGNVKNLEVSKVKTLTDIDVTGYKRVIGANDVKHIAERHGKNGKHDNSMSNINDIGRIGYVMDNYDKMYRTVDQNGKPVYTNAYLGKDGKPSPQITYEKRVDGHVYVVSTVIDSNKKHMRISSAYMTEVKKTKNPQTGIAQSHNPYAQNASAGSIKDSIPDSTAKNNDSIEKTIKDMRAEGKTEDEILDYFESNQYDPYEVYRALEGVDNDVIVLSKAEAKVKTKIEMDSKAYEEWKNISEVAYKNADSTTQKATIGEQVKYDNPKPQEALKRAMKTGSKEEIGQLAKNAKDIYFTSDELASLFDEKAIDGLFSKADGLTQKEALEIARDEVYEDLEGTYKAFIKQDISTLQGRDAHLVYARARTLMDELSLRHLKGEDVAEKMLYVTDKCNELASHNGRALNATKLLLKNTPQGRLRIAAKDVENLNKRYGARLNGKEIKLTDDQISRILKANDDEITDVLGKINIEIWDEIPATLFEKMNEMRHLSMLGNVKTHERNFIGNFIFKQARAVSNGMEIMLNKMAKSHIEKMGGEVDMVKASRKLIKENKELLNKEFDETYKASGSKNRYIETTRPDGSKTIKLKPLNAAIQANYKLLEWEDVVPTFRPEFRKNYARYCQSRGLDVKNLTDLQKTQARRYALEKAEEATFRDSCKFSNWLTGAKTKTAGKVGKTSLGTFGYRAANMALESTLPFVKTPVNVFRRSVDYSPISFIPAITKLHKATDPEMFKQGLHQLATGLTGTGVMGLGMFMASQDLITVKTGGVSGDEYYDRDMGYQDYSLILHVGGKEYSMTIDWASPMQSSLFMGAEVFNNLSEDGFAPSDVWNCLTAMTNPMLDMSFMSSAKDTFETFIDQAYRTGNGEKDWSGALAQALFGSIPQGYLGGFVPQISSQLAGALDSKQRDTRSTKEDPIAKSWDSWGRKMINRVPVLRNHILNPKLDRFGNDKETGGNIATRFVQSLFNPSNVKEINVTKLDKEIIAIYNHMEEGSDEKKFYYYNFTGNPNYDLGDGKRMSYDEAYKYGKENRKEQTSIIEKMVKSASYKNMTWDMRAKEVSDGHWIGQTTADYKTYGAKFAADRIVKTGNDSDKEARKINTMSGGNDKDFVNFYLTKEKLIARAHNTDYYTKAMAVALSGNDNMALAYGINMDKVKAAKKYLKAGGSESEFSDASCNIMSGIKKAGATVSTSNKAFSAADYSINERTYKALGIDDQKANMGVGLKKYGYTYDLLMHHKFMASFAYDADESGTLNKKEIKAYIDSLGLSSRAEKACLFEYFSSAKNPYGSVPNYLGLKDTSSGGGSGRGSRRYGGRGGRKGKAKTAKEKKPKMPSWEDYVKDYMSNSKHVKSVKFKDWDSPLDKAYRAKVEKILKNS